MRNNLVLSKLAAGWAAGHVTAAWKGPNGELDVFYEHHNVISYNAADVMAHLLGGNSQYAPGYIGFIYGGTHATPGFTDPPTSRDQTWSGLATELADASTKGNILIAPFSNEPGFTVDGSTALYTGNKVAFAAHSGEVLQYGFATSPADNPYSDALADGDYFYHAMLLSRIVTGSVVSFIPFARVSLKLAAGFPTKPVGWDLALFWDISYA